MKKILIAATALLAFAACKKDKDENKTRTQHLTAGKWFSSTSSYSYKLTDSLGNVIDSENSTDTVEACEKDNFIMFNTDGTLTADAGTVKCDPSEDQVTNGTWKLISNDTKIQITEDGDSYDFQIFELNGTSFNFGFDTTYTTMGYKYEQRSEIRMKH